ncbi:MAG: AAA family ATPase [Muribaculaceae bacterium]|nr:AAA family ATPase [Muribaculaceae bacterium]
MTSEEFAAEILRNLPYAANEQQRAVVGALSRFCAPGAPETAVFILNGYAGTGKTSLTGALVRALPAVGLSSVLMAPTGRAAKVFGTFAGRAAYTIHRRIYRHSPQTGLDAGPSLVLNRARNTLFIVDEASMIGGDDTPDRNNLLEDLVQYVYSGDNCRLLLIGDTAQLPPVGSAESPAMNPDVLRAMGLRPSHATMTATMRQGPRSGILWNATSLRRALAAGADHVPQLRAAGFPDVSIVAGEDLPEMLETAYARDGLEETLLISRSNRRATEYNRAIRSDVLYREEMLTRDEMLIVAKNNYYWARPVRGLDFVANGDIVRVARVYGTEWKYGFQFADVRLAVAGSGGEAEFDAKLMLEALCSETASMPYERMQLLYEALVRDPELFEPSMPYDLRARALRDNPYWNALQVKYAYAMTCHKAQGGQWQNVFIDLSYIPDDALGPELYRWLYTAVSRARAHLYLIAPPEQLLG